MKRIELSRSLSRSNESKDFNEKEKQDANDLRHQISNDSSLDSRIQSIYLVYYSIGDSLMRPMGIFIG